MRGTTTSARRTARPRRWWLGLLSGLVLVVSACGGGATAGTSAQGEIDPEGTFRYVFVQNPSTFDPHRSANPWDMVFFRLVYDQLIMLDENDELAPQLATSWEFVDDETALVLELRDDVTFIDGTPFDAEAVKANLERAKTLETSALKGQLARIESVEPTGEFTVRINLNGPGGDLPALFSSTAGSMISPAAFDNADLDQNPVGSGMATLVEYVPGQLTRYDRNEEYWDPDAAKAAHYEILVQTSATTRFNMLQTGQAELTYLDPSQAEQAEAAGLNSAPSKSMSIMSMYMNTGKAPFDDIRVRQAVQHAVDRQVIVDGVFFGLGEPVAQYMPPDHWAYNPDVTPEGEYGYDPERARELLAEAGYPDGVDFEFLVPSLDDHRAVAEALVPMLAEVGLRATTRVIESPTTPVTFYSRQEGNAFPGMGAPFADPTIPYQGSLPGQFANPWNTTTDEFQQAWTDSLSGATREDRVEALHRMVEAEKGVRKSFPLHAHFPPSAWTDRAVFPEGYQPAYAPTFRGVGVTA
ncbi:peptide/nickel transport system substrate-binding protein [Geodermatophilus sabuli]|uniref:Peptide/nickel transport system substrate-binding protein n=1 Tax=Geodermatophilus sabuli TaxID=1564158 RepID=A0A285E9G2_9ACTN|nr:peptide/nickel transport system substrate-binding protein [Geodermatophilus sabuli]